MVDGAAAAFDVYMRGLRVSPGKYLISNFESLYINYQKDSYRGFHLDFYYHSLPWPDDNFAFQEIRNSRVNLQTFIVNHLEAKQNLSHLR